MNQSFLSTVAYQTNCGPKLNGTPIYAYGGPTGQNYASYNCASPAADGDFITLLYLDGLQREPDTLGWNSWFCGLEPSTSGCPPGTPQTTQAATVTSFINNSSEFSNHWAISNTVTPSFVTSSGSGGYPATQSLSVQFSPSQGGAVSYANVYVGSGNLTSWNGQAPPYSNGTPPTGCEVEWWASNNQVTLTQISNGSLSISTNGTLGPGGTTQITSGSFCYMYPVNSSYSGGVLTLSLSYGATMYGTQSVWAYGADANGWPTLPWVQVGSVTISSGAQYSLTTAVNPLGAGTITLTPAGGPYNPGTQVAVQANPSSGYTFSSFSGDLSGSTNPQYLTMNRNMSVTANFTAATPAISGLTVSGSSTVSGVPVSSGGVVYLTVTLASPAPPAGTAINFSTDNPSAFPAPANCTVPAGSVSATCSGAAGAVNNTTQVIVTPSNSSGPLAYPAALYVIPAKGYSPTQTGINIGALPVDVYTSLNNPLLIAAPIQVPAGNGLPSFALPGCPSTSTIRSCVQGYLKNWSQQGATNVRVFLGLAIPLDMPLSGSQEWVYYYNGPQVGTGPGSRDGSYSHPWIMQGASPIVDTTGWARNLGYFFADAAQAHLTVTVTLSMVPATADTHIADPSNQSAVDCANGSLNLMFVPWLPYGQDWNTTIQGQGGYDDCTSVYHAYSEWAYPRLDGNGNTQDEFFWGWAPFQNLVQTIVNEAAWNGASVPELEIQQEVNLSVSGVLARLIYDNRHGTSDQRSMPAQPPGSFDVIGWTRSAMGSNAVTFSTSDQHTTSFVPYTCNSLYNDPGSMFYASQLAGAIGGPAYLGAQGKFGTSNSSFSDANLPCTGGEWDLMDSLPPGQGHTQPSVLDMHSYPCIVDGGDNSCLQVNQGVTEQQQIDNAKQYYSDVATFTSKYGFSHVAFGESSIVQFGASDTGNPTANCSVGGLPDSDIGAYWAVQGYLQSNLRSQFNNQQTTFLPFNVIENACYSNAVVLWPYDSLHSNQ